MLVKTTRAKCVFELMDGEEISTPCWVNPIIPRQGKVILGSYAKAGKTACMLSIIRALVTGENLFNCPRYTIPEPANVLIFEQELGEAGFQRRIKKVFHGISRRKSVKYLSRDSDVSFSDHKGIELIGNEIADARPNIVILDPIGAMFHGDENSSQEIGMFWREINRMLAMGVREDMTFIISHHFGKRPNGKAAENFDFLDPYNFRGSGKWYDAPDTMITMNRLQDINVQGHRAWRLQMRITLRQDEPQPEIYCTVNRDGDLRVLYERDVDPPQPVTTPAPMRVNLGRNNVTTNPTRQ